MSNHSVSAQQSTASLDQLAPELFDKAYSNYTYQDRGMSHFNVELQNFYDGWPLIESSSVKNYPSEYFDLKCLKSKL